MYVPTTCRYFTVGAKRGVNIEMVKELLMSEESRKLQLCLLYVEFEHLHIGIGDYMMVE